MSKKALIAMSGGVDSSVAAAEMVKDGWDCIGVTMKLYRGEENQCNGKACCTLSDAEDARSVAYDLGMPFYVFNFTDDFDRQVIHRFVDAYEQGRTPNPCIDCNRYMKFDKLYQRAKALGCDVVVTGHYARVQWDEERQRWLLLKSRNEVKDQSYVLYFMTQEQLAHTRFPLGEYESKEIVRNLAAEHGFATAHKQDSQDICFVQGGRYVEFIENYTHKQYPQGEFVDKQGNVMGQHKGVIGYTIGQRKGLGLSLKEPMYVCGKCPESNQVVLGSQEDLMVTELWAEDFNWISCEPPTQPMEVSGKTRYHGQESPAFAVQQEDGLVHIRFTVPQRAAAPGQAVVLYQGDVVVGGGVIAKTKTQG